MKAVTLILLISDAMHFNFACSLVTRSAVVLAIMRQRVGLGRADAVADDSNAGHVVVILVLEAIKVGRNI